MPSASTTAPLADALALAREFEGLRLDAYHDVAGFPTQGYGRLLSRERWADLGRWTRVSPDVAEEWLATDMAKSARAVRRLCPVYLEEHQLAALADFAFNLGAGSLEASTLRRVINRGEFERVPEQLARWVYAGGTKLPGLVRRRRAEADLFSAATVKSGVNAFG